MNGHEYFDAVMVAIQKLKAPSGRVIERDVSCLVTA